MTTLLDILGRALAPSEVVFYDEFKAALDKYALAKYAIDAAEILGGGDEETVCNLFLNPDIDPVAEIDREAESLGLTTVEEWTYGRARHSMRRFGA